ncbi:ferrous iron transporter B [Paratractidigestivibacter sp.]|uniref:ferrous iron transporter B n=1 Tax=Paratractidigestivibacter sp. TaxID=2847316 RepID=UPI002ABE93BF|nr:ferrous iron transporter B [Paratractidigestivibacter sp.]
MAETFIGLAGNPNCGKTTLFNELTGSNGYVGNWPGVTVEKKQAKYRADKDVTFVDLPGIYSLSPYTPEEIVSRDYIVNERPDAIIDLIDVTNLERNLYLATQILEAGRPVVVGLNMCDLLKERGDKVDVAKLSERLGCPAIEVSALHNTNIDALVKAAREAKTPATGTKCFSAEVEEALGKIAEKISGNCAPELVRWYSVKVFERDAEAIKPLNLTSEQNATIEPLIEAVETARDDDSESIITSDRYDWISETMAECVVKAPKKLTTSEKIDKVVTNRFLGLPIFVLIMFLVYYIAISTVGTAGTDWVNDNLFGDGFFVNGASQEQYEADTETWGENHYADQVAGFVSAAEADGVVTADSAAEVTSAVDALKEDPDDVVSGVIVEDFAAGTAKANVVATDVTITDEDGNPTDETIDSVDTTAFLNAVEGVQSEPAMADYDGYVPSVPIAVEGWLDNIGASPMVKSLVIDGVIGGVGSVLGFIPQMFVLFVLLCFLEDCGYMSRVAFVMDRVFRRFGLSGKSFIPMLISTGCGVPGVLATKTIENEKDRRMTAMLTTMIPCGAKTPIIALVMGVLIGGSDAWWVAPMFYFLGIAAIIISAIMLKKTKPFAGEPTPFVMELPNYHFPTLKSWWLHVWERVSSYIKKAATIIFAASVVVWFLSNFGFANWDGGNGAFGYLPELEGAGDEANNYSLLAIIGGALGFIFAPLGADHWQAVAASISALIAKENLVSTFGTLYGLGEVSENSLSLWTGFAAMFTDASGVLHVGAMLGFVAFNMLDAPCFAAMGTIRRQMDDSKWFWFAIAYQCVFGWIVGMIINQLWELFVLGNFGVWTVIAFACLAAMLFQLFRPTPKFEETKAKILTDLNQA